MSCAKQIDITVLDLYAALHRAGLDQQSKDQVTSIFKDDFGRYTFPCLSEVRYCKLLTTAGVPQIPLDNAIKTFRLLGLLTD